MASLLIADIPESMALDYEAMAAIRGSGSGDWVLYAFSPYKPASSPVVNFYQTNYYAQNLTLQTENIAVDAAAGASVAVNALQNALTANAQILPGN